MEVKQAYSPRIEDIIFENRNKSYGAYDIRQKYGKHVGIATAVAVTFLVLALLSPLVIDKLKPEEEIVPVVDRVVTINELEAPPPLDETKPPPPTVEVPPPPKVIQFVPPTVTVEEVVEEPPTIKEIKENVTGNTNIDGDATINYVPPVEERKIIEEPTKKEEIYEFVDESPSPAGGMGAFYEYLRNNIKYPPQASENNIQGTVYLELIIGVDGKPRDVNILKDIGGGCGAEAVRVVKNMPAWTPGKQNGRAVPVRIKLPVKFVLAG